MSTLYVAHSLLIHIQAIQSRVAEARLCQLAFIKRGNLFGSSARPRRRSPATWLHALDGDGARRRGGARRRARVRPRGVRRWQRSPSTWWPSARRESLTCRRPCTPTSTRTGRTVRRRPPTGRAALPPSSRRWEPLSVGFCSVAKGDYQPGGGSHDQHDHSSAENAACVIRNRKWPWCERSDVPRRDPTRSTAGRLALASEPRRSSSRGPRTHPLPRRALELRLPS